MSGAGIFSEENLWLNLSYLECLRPVVEDGDPDTQLFSCGSFWCCFHNDVEGLRGIQLQMSGLKRE